MLEAEAIEAAGILDEPAYYTAECPSCGKTFTSADEIEEGEPCEACCDEPSIDEGEATAVRYPGDAFGESPETPADALADLFEAELGKGA